MDSILQKLLRRGDSVAIERGRLVIRPASGLPVPEQWLADNRLRLCREVLVLAGLDAFEYVGYDTGHYGKSRAGGVTLHFVSVVTGEAVYTIFNAELKRVKDSPGGKTGALLPKGEFRVGKRSAFYKFWLGTGLAVPDRLQRFCRRMGTLRPILFDGDLQGERLNASTLTPIEIPADLIRVAVSGHKPDTSKTQTGHTVDTNTRHSRMRQSQASQGIQPISTTCVSNHGNTVIREDGYTVDVPVLNTSPEDQSVDDWLKEYDQASSWN
ncbi:hypothetical protein QAO71_15770 [Halopseudomonas sp. SMJS2]|uniref:hypothetical protein n=1 Tax=Halopseudomonas sp. SMJS2 TaxID=3041098 RepID=UPI00245322D6|nr:hypothetical protein [Halopseudomonas sp. SMJS2]WGK61483.1 hypothetical protein QAO71_15770 [Halopseudomonas sp. SMJS2]